MASRLTWNGPAAQSYVHRKAVADITRVVKAIADRARQLVSTPGPEPSAPGQPPHAQTWALHHGINYEVDEHTKAWRVGTNAPEGLFTEMGTRNMAARPWLRPAMAEVIPQMNSILGSAK